MGGRPIGGAGIGNRRQSRRAISMNTLIRLWKDESGASAAEYALILAIVGTAIAAAAIFLGGVIATEINETGTCIQTEGATCG